MLQLRLNAYGGNLESLKMGRKGPTELWETCVASWRTGRLSNEVGEVARRVRHLVLDTDGGQGVEKMGGKGKRRPTI